MKGSSVGCVWNVISTGGGEVQGGGYNYCWGHLLGFSSDSVSSLAAGSLED